MDAEDRRSITADVTTMGQELEILVDRISSSYQLVTTTDIDG